MDKIGLVFSGEGGRSAYHIGVWKAIIEWDMVNDISTVLGTSTGILNALLFAAEDYDAARNIWLNLKSRDVMKLDSNLVIKKFPSEVHKKYNSTIVFLESSVKDLINNYVNTDALRKSRINVYACAYNKTKACIDYFHLNNLSRNEIIEIVLASMALPGVQSDNYIDNCLYYDSGVKSDIYLKPFADDNNIKDSVIVCHCNEVLKVASEFDNFNIIEIAPHDNELFNDNLNFSPVSMTKRIKKGYNDATRMFDLVYRGMEGDLFY